MHSLPPIRYGKSEISGIPVRPDSRVIVLKAIEGHPIDVFSGNDYINLYHVFDRLVASYRDRFKGLKFYRKQMGRSKWRIFVAPEGADLPDVEVESGYDPKRGRYKRYAESLAAGELVEVESHNEAIKVRRAWQLYVPKEERKHLRAKVEALGRKNARYSVKVIDRSSNLGGVPRIDAIE